jgi:hypothetical protein
MTRAIFDDEYTGPRYRYGLQNRPIGGANIPAGWIIWSGRASTEFRHGTLDYPAKLPEGTADNFELIFVGEFAQ